MISRLKTDMKIGQLYLFFISLSSSIFLPFLSLSISLYLYLSPPLLFLWCIIEWDLSQFRSISKLNVFMKVNVSAWWINRSSLDLLIYMTCRESDLPCYMILIQCRTVQGFLLYIYIADFLWLISISNLLLYQKAWIRTFHTSFLTT